MEYGTSSDYMAVTGMSSVDEESAETVTDFAANYSLVDLSIDMDELRFHHILYKVVVPVMFGLIIAVGVIGNALVVYITLTCRAMRTTVNLLLLNLAASDVLFLVVAVPFMAYHYAADNWLIGDVACKLSHFILYATVYVTVYTLVAIAVVRFICIVRSSPRPIPAAGDGWRVAAVVAVVWATMLGVNSPLLALYRVKKFKLSPDSAPYYFCGLDDHTRSGPPLFISFFMLTYVVPLSIIITMYLLIVRYLVARRQSLGSQTNGLGDGASGRMQRLQRRRTSYASRVFVAVVVVFGVCWLPMHVHLLIAYFGLQPQNRAYAVYRVFCHCMAYSNSCVNPFVYHYVSADFRRCLADVVAAVTGGSCGRGARRSRQRRYSPEECTVPQMNGVNTLEEGRF